MFSTDLKAVSLPPLDCLLKELTKDNETCNKSDNPQTSISHNAVKPADTSFTLHVAFEMMISNTRGGKFISEHSESIYSGTNRKQEKKQFNGDPQFCQDKTLELLSMNFDKFDKRVSEEVEAERTNP